MVQSFNFKQKVYKETRSSTVEIFETIFRPNQNGQMNKNQRTNQPTNKQTQLSLQTSKEWLSCWGDGWCCGRPQQLSIGGSKMGTEMKTLNLKNESICSIIFNFWRSVRRNW